MLNKKKEVFFVFSFSKKEIAAVGQWIRAFAPQAGVRIPASTDKSRKNRQGQIHHCLTLGNRCECHRSSDITIVNGCHVSQ